MEVTYSLTDILCGRIPRNEVERIVRLVMKELEGIQPGCHHTIAGGYVQFVPPVGTHVDNTALATGEARQKATILTSSSPIQRPIERGFASYVTHLRTCYPRKVL